MVLRAAACCMLHVVVRHYTLCRVTALGSVWVATSRLHGPCT
eukprot:COSAG02_NODE_41279_length_396_cov_0.703704_1_plen_41_part_10